jgi:hypothetical protein
MQSDDIYLDIILRRVRVCKSYKPRFGQGQGSGLSLEEFRRLYGSDMFYSWFGLDNPLMYAAHKVAGGITSVYRQIGIGCEELFRQILRDQFGLTALQTTWSYEVPKPDGTNRRLSLDGRLSIEHVVDPSKREKLISWMKEAADLLKVAPEVTSALNGAVFEVRQGYKSKDSKRQNADIANAATAYSRAYLPVAMILSTQIDNDIVYRYQMQRWLILRGFNAGAATHSTYSFMREIVGFDLAGFFSRNAATIKTEVEDVLEVLLSPHDEYKA